MDLKHLEAFHKSLKDLVGMARKVAERGYSYRDFKVGCAILAWRPQGIGLTEEYRKFKAANAKPIEGGPKFCAEMTTCCYARSNGFEKIIAIVIAGLPQADGASGILSETLHPCEVCRPFLTELPEIMPDTRIVTVHNHTGLIEEFTLTEILQIHGNKIPWSLAS